MASGQHVSVDRGEAVEQAFVDTLARIRKPAWEEDRRGVNFIGVEFDALSENITRDRWDNLRVELNSTLREIKPKFKLAVLAMARDEAPYLTEWIAHYLSIGAEHIFIYTNDNIDGTDEVLRWFAQNAPVTPLFTTAEVGVNIQKKNYEHAFFLLPELRLYEWVAVVDVDEFLVPAERFDHNLQTMLSAAPEDAAAIVFPWSWRLWDRQFERSQGLLAERFQYAISHNLFKSVVRMNQVISLCEVHIPTIGDYATLYDTEFKQIHPDQIWTSTHKSFGGGRIEHFWGRSFEEFVIKKARGDSLAIPTGQFKRDYHTFFAWTAPYSETNHLPISSRVLHRSKKLITHFEGSAQFQSIMATISRRYDEIGAEFRGSNNLRATYKEMLQTVNPEIQPAPSPDVIGLAHVSPGG